MQILKLKVKPTAGITQVLVLAYDKLNSMIIAEPKIQKALKQTPKK